MKNSPITSKNWRDLHSGVSLILAIILISAMLLSMASLTETIVRINKWMRLEIDAGAAENIAKSAMEFGRTWARVSGIGANTGDEVADNGANGSAVITERLKTILLRNAANNGVPNCAARDYDPWKEGDQPCVVFSVKGRAADSDKVEFLNAPYYSVPIAGTGDADNEEHCSQLTAQQRADSDNACNWNKLKLGESVEIPLYYEESGPRAPFANLDRKADVNWRGFDDALKKVNLAVPGSFKLRIRTPCKGYREGVVNCDKRDRIILYPQVQDNDPYRNIEKDKVIIQWLVTDAQGGESLIAREELSDERDERGKKVFRPNVSESPSPRDSIGMNTQLSSGRINYARENFDGVLDDYIVLSSELEGGLKLPDDAESTLADFVNNQPRPFFKLNYVGQARRIDPDNPPREKWPRDPKINLDIPAQNIQLGQSMSSAQLNDFRYKVPFLEYQILTSEAAGPVPDSKATIIGEASVGDVHKEFKWLRKLTPTLGGFVLENP